MSNQEDGAPESGPTISLYILSLPGKDHGILHNPYLADRYNFFLSQPTSRTN